MNEEYELQKKYAAVYRLLSEAYGTPQWRAHLPPVDELVSTILSQATSDINRDKGFAALKERYGTWEEVLQAPVAERGRARLAPDLFGQPDLPLIDGRGKIWWPGACDTHAMWDYTLGHQVTEAYDFTHALAVAAREFAPDLFILVGPGDTLGGAVVQSLIATGWQGMADKQGFVDRQGDTPVLVSMGRTDQRGAVA